MEDYEKKYELGSIVTAKRTYNGETITGEFDGFHLLDKSNPKSIVGIVHTNDGSYDVEPNSIETVISEDEKIRKDIIRVFTGEIGFTTKEEAKKYIAWLEKQGEQKLPSLSEKIVCLKRILDFLQKEHNSYTGEDFTNEIAVLEWLITHPVLIQSSELQQNQGEQKPTWSEEDEKLYTWCASAIQTRYNDGLFTMDEYRETSLWLKSLKERYTWKPSDEQIKALNYIINLMASSERPTENSYYYNVFKDMRTQLKKLR